MSPLKFRFDKLVRDKIPDELQRNGVNIIYTRLQPDERLKALKNKLVEEVRELVLTKSKFEVLTELGDVYDVLDILQKLHGLRLDSTQISCRGRSLDFLYNKLLEACNIMQHSDDKSLVLIDVDITLESIAARFDIINDELFDARKEKNEMRGGFLLRIFAEYIEVDQFSDQRIVQYFKNRPEKYPVMQ